MLKDILAKRKAGKLGGVAYTLTLENGGLKVAYNPAYKLPAGREESRRRRHRGHQEGQPSRSTPKEEGGEARMKAREARRGACLAEVKTCRVEMRDITKRFPGVLANSKVCFDVSPGEVHALLGENGAGKSTLMRQLYGMYQPDSGQILVDGAPSSFRSPADAIARGNRDDPPALHARAHAHRGRERRPRRALRRWPLFRHQARRRPRAELAEEYGLKVDPEAYVWQLSVGEQQRVEIVKALYKGAGLIILDEPTAVLTPQEVDDLFDTLRRMVGEGHSLVFISHKLGEVMAISDRVTVLRDGKVVGAGRTSEMSRDELVRMMVGREVKELEARRARGGGESAARSRACAPRATAATRPCAASTSRCARARSSAWPASRATASASSPSASRACAPASAGKRKPGRPRHRRRHPQRARRRGHGLRARRAHARRRDRRIQRDRRTSSSTTTPRPSSGAASS